MSEFVIVNTACGKVLGIKKCSSLETSFNAFLGVPYATAPVGKLRFKVGKLVMTHRDVYGSL